MIFVPFPQRVSPISEPPFLPGKTCRRRAVAPNGLFPGGQVCGLTGPTLFATRQTSSSRAADANTWHTREIFLVNLSNGRHFGAATGCLPNTAEAESRAVHPPARPVDVETSF